MLTQTFPLTVTKKDPYDSYILYGKKRKISLCFSFEDLFLNYSQFTGFLRKESRTHSPLHLETFP